MLRRTDPKAEMAWMVVIFNPGHGHELTWYESQAEAEKAAEWELEQAKEGDYAITVYVAQSLKQGSMPCE